MYNFFARINICLESRKICIIELRIICLDAWQTSLNLCLLPILERVSEKIRKKTHFASNKSWYGLSSYLEIYLALEPSCEVFVLFIFTEIFIIADIQGFNRIDFNWNLLAILLLLLQTLFNLKEHVSYS